ncbi:MAG: tetratricopeptide repeat protein [Sedimentibacter sp.]|uniref:tetratricopeptide repeat protein n=1 Tax=Sedimentibacter sp. TaxID=1960295 RepID=UPI0031583995
MNSISVRLLGEPSVKINGKEVFFPYKKAEGLFYYVCITKKVSRQEAINMFWAETSEETARKNLRDAIYKIKKVLGDDVFVDSSKSSIELNSEIQVKTDTDMVSQENIMEYYGGEFLGNFLIKNCLEFENWILEKKEEYRNLYMNAVSKKVNESVNMGDFKSIQNYSKVMISSDPYNEKTYRYFMKIYALSGDYNKAIKLYYELADILKKDLEIGPESATKKMFREILKLKDMAVDKSGSMQYFYGRYNELFSISSNLYDFAEKSGISVFVTGEAGIGKTALLDKIAASLDSDKTIILRSSCYSAEEDFFLKPWHNIFSMLGDCVRSEKIYISPQQEEIISYVFPLFNRDMKYNKSDIMNKNENTIFELAVDVIIRMLQKLSEKKQIIFVFDDIQWMDKMSKMLISNIISRFCNTNILFLGAYRSDFESKLNSFIIPLVKSDLLMKIKLNRFTFDETRSIVEEYLPTFKISDSLLANIYEDTEGNALFLTELLKTIKEKGYTRELSFKAANIINSRIMDLNKHERMLLNYISLFFDKVSIDCLKMLVSFDEMEVFEIIESLQEKDLIREFITDKDIFYSFTHQKIREFIYDSQSAGKKMMLHEKIGNYFEDRFKSSGNKNLYPNLIYHFEKCGNKYKSLKYKIENLTDLYTMYHETYPVFSFESSVYSDFQDIFNVEEKLNEISDDLAKLDDNDTEYFKIRMEFCYLAGRYYIAVGEYGKGLENIDSSLRIADKLENYIYLLNNYKQMIFYAIQVNDIPVMFKYINKSLKLLSEYDNIEERGTMLRLKGLYYNKIKKYDEAETLFNESINIFNNLNKINSRYTLSISANYNYLGQQRAALGRHEEAIAYYKKAVDLCKDNGISKGLEIFYSNIGQSLYETKKYDEAEYYIRLSIDLFHKYECIWGRDMAECYLALLLINKKNFDEANSHLAHAQECAKKLNNPKSLKLTEDIKKLLK